VNAPSKAAGAPGAVTVLHNPRCSKSRRALELLGEHGADVRTIEYLREPPARETLLEWIRASKDPPAAFVRADDLPRVAPDARVGPETTAEQVADLLAAHPALLQRPVARAGGRVVVGRPPERVLDLLRPEARR
jgi:arsenate reductase